MTERLVALSLRTYTPGRPVPGDHLGRVQPWVAHMDIEARKTVSGWILLAVSGRIDAHTAPQFEAACDEQLAQKPAKLAVDLSAVSYLSSAGLRVLLATLKRIDKFKGQMALLGPRDNVREVLEISGFSSLFRIVERLDELS